MQSSIIFGTLFNFFSAILIVVLVQSSTNATTHSTIKVSNNTLLAIVSDRSASTLVAGAHLYLKQFPQANIQVRTVSQITQLSDIQLTEIVNQSNALLMVAVFGEQVERLLNIKYPSRQQRFVFQGDRRLLTLHHDSLGDIFTAQNISLLSDLFSNQSDDLDAELFLLALQKKWPNFRNWLQARAFWVNRSINNASNLIKFIVNPNSVAKLESISSVRFVIHSVDKFKTISSANLTSALNIEKPIVWLLDHDTGDRAGDWELHQQLCHLEQLQCISVLAAWGKPSLDALITISKSMKQSHLQKVPWTIVSLQDFVIGGGEGRESVTKLLAQLNIPVFKGIRLTEWTEAQWRLSSKGLPTDSVHYRLAMPELQGIGQAQILAFASEQQEDNLTGAKLIQSLPHKPEIKRLSKRIQRLFVLQQKSNQDKKVAIVYYNHPPGRHNIGADNLNVVDSILDILRSLKKQGYQTGILPKNSKALLDLLQERGINLPDDKKALSTMAKIIPKLSTENYQKWFTTLPKTITREMVYGPLGQLHQQMKTEIRRLVKTDNLKLQQSQFELLQHTMHMALKDIQHALDGIRQRGRERALNLVLQLEKAYLDIILDSQQGRIANWQLSDKLSQALINMAIEGIRGWGKPPGNIMVWENQLLIPGLQFGNIYIGPQPPRGWELNEELLHANMSFPPTHQYLAFYHYLRDVFAADALVHVGRHSTYEFLPKRSVGLSASDYPSLIVADLPSIYPYIVDGVGEGIQAKRRGVAVMIDHLTPPLAITELYDDLLQLRQLIESAEATSDENTRSLAVKALRHKIDALNLRDEIIASMDEELKVRGIGFEQIDDDFLLHEVGHYLTQIQERFMPLGLHVFGRDWNEKSINTMLTSMAEGEKPRPQWRDDLSISPQAEMHALIDALNGGYIAPGKGNDPIRTPASLPTGRNFYALDGGLLPTKIGYDIGRQLAEKVHQGSKIPPNKTNKTIINNNKQAVILWASDAVRDEGAMIAFGMNLLGVKPIWNSRGIIKGLERLPLNAVRQRRIDVLFTTSGLFRDLYGEHLLLLDKAGLLALDASRDLIATKFPALALALNESLKPLGEWQTGGHESLLVNQVAANWVETARTLLKKQPTLSATQVGRQASLRVFGSAQGAYGAGINRLVERSGAWQERRELGNTYLKRMGHAYGVGVQGEPAQNLFKQQLLKVGHTYLGRASHLYGLIDNNDAFDYLGGLNLAIETLTGHTPASSVINHANNSQLRIDALPKALLSELRGRFLNPQWIKPLMKQEYAGARTMGSEFIEYLWGWQVTNPEIIDDWVWQEVKQVYIDDSHDLGLDNFLSQDHNRYVQTNILAIMLVAIEKGFWQADATTQQQLAEQFTQNIIEHGIPGSGHTHAYHPVYDFVKEQISVEQAEQLSQSRLAKKQPDVIASHIQEVNLDDARDTQNKQKIPNKESQNNNNAAKPNTDNNENYVLWFLLLGLLVMTSGYVREKIRR